MLPFFRRLEGPEHQRGFNEAVKDFIVKVFRVCVDTHSCRGGGRPTTDTIVRQVQKRAVEKRKEMEEARKRGEDVDGYAELEEEERLGPGGLDPVQVFESLPAAMQEAFESRDMGRLHAALAAMPVEEAKRHMKACEDSGALVVECGDGWGRRCGWGMDGRLPRRD